MSRQEDLRGSFEQGGRLLVEIEGTPMHSIVSNEKIEQNECPKEYTDHYWFIVCHRFFNHYASRVGVHKVRPTAPKN